MRHLREAEWIKLWIINKKLDVVLIVCLFRFLGP